MTAVEELATALAGSYAEPLPQPVEREARRSLLNVLGTAIGASGHPLIDHVVDLAQAHGGTPAVAPPGRGERLDPYFAALATGAAAHVDDFDDTHLATVIHPGAAALAAAWAVALWRERTGDELVRAFALGCEAQLRLGVAVSPDHYDQGWHITGTCGVVGAAATASLLHDGTVERVADALAWSAHQTLGHREGFGTHAKALHAGKAAANGVAAALLAPASPAPRAGSLEELCAVLAPRSEATAIVDDFGVRWDLLANTYKPYPCGIVAHPGIDAAIELAPRIRDAGTVAAIAYRCNPLVPELMGRTDPVDGLQARFSAVHGVAAGLLRGRAGLAEYADVAVRDPDLAALRGRTTLRVEPEFARDEAALDVTLTDGRELRAHVRHARGSAARPLTDAELSEKVADLVDPFFPDFDLAAAVAELSSRESLCALAGLLCTSVETLA